MSSAFEGWKLREKRDTLLQELEEAAQMAEELTWPPTPVYLSDRVRYELMPGILNARTYVEVGRIREPEVRESLAEARLVAGNLANEDREFARLHSKLRALVETADKAARGE